MQQLISDQNLLQELEQQGAFSEQKIRELLSDLWPILQSVHEEQVIYRDIKPENIICRRSDGKLVLIDFGVAKLATATAMAKTGTTIGSFGYAPIEQMKGGEAYPASDLYSLGVTCFHLLTGIDPWQLWTDQGYGWVSDWRQHLKSPLSQELDLVLTKLLQKDITEHYPSVEAVLKDLNRLSERSPSARPTVAQSPKQPPQPAVPPTLPPPPQLSPLPPVASAKHNGKFKNTLLVGGAILLLGLVGTQIYGYFRYKLFPSNPICLKHVQTNTVIELPQNLSVIYIGKPNDQSPPNVDVSGFPNSDIVSRIHADIRVEGDAYYIEDVGSSNGTYINDKPLSPGNRHACEQAGAPRKPPWGIA